MEALQNLILSPMSVMPGLRFHRGLDFADLPRIRQTPKRGKMGD
jgi:hypothetical protein